MHEPDLKRNTTKEQQTVTPLGPSSGMGNPFVMGKLTPRETEVAELLLKGITYENIGKELKMSRRSVRAHVERMLERFNIHGCAHPRIVLAVLLSK